MKSGQQEVKSASRETEDEGGSVSFVYIVAFGSHQNNFLSVI